MANRRNFSSAIAAENTGGTPNDPPAELTINPDVFSGNLKNLLIEIRDTDASLLKGKIAEYAGFYLDANKARQWDSTSNRGNQINLPNNPASTTSQPNKSIDKLTFIIMFWLPSSKAALNSYYGDPLNSASTFGPSGNIQSWSHRANNVRSDFSLKKLNAAGEQVQHFVVSPPAVPVAGWYPVDDSGAICGSFGTPAGANDFSKFSNAAGYAVMGIDLATFFPDNLQARAAGFGLPTPAQERAAMFDATNVRNKIPAYFLEVATEEAGYDRDHWVNDTVNDRQCCRGILVPTSSTAQVRMQRFIRFMTDLNGRNPVGKIIQINTFGFYIDFNGQLVFVSQAAGDDHTFQQIGMVGATIRKAAGALNYYVAEFPDLDTTTADKSGYTFGTGLDIGNAFGTILRVEFTIGVKTTASGTFRLFYGNKYSPEVTYSTITQAIIRTTLQNLIPAGNRITLGAEVVSGEWKNYPVKIELGRDRTVPFRHRVYCPTADLSQVNPNISITPNDENARWIQKNPPNSPPYGTGEEGNPIKNSYYIFKKTMCYSYSNQPFFPSTTNFDGDFWLKQNALIAVEQTQMKSVVMRAFGMQYGAARALRRTNKALQDRLAFRSYVQMMRGCFYEYFIPKFYNRTRANEDNITIINSTNLTSRVLGRATLRTQPNQAELTIMASLCINWPNRFADHETDFIRAINTHKYSELVACANILSYNDIRHGKALEFIRKEALIRNLYRGLKD